MPLATYTGSNLYKAPLPEGALCDRFGTYVPFVATREERGGAQALREVATVGLYASGNAFQPKSGVIFFCYAAALVREPMEIAPCR